MDLQMKKKMADTIRFLAADMVQKANSGHPGAALGLADIMVELSEVINITPHNPQFINRDRIVFSGGHATPLIYSMLYLWGYDISLDDLKNFRQLGSITPGHPEYGHTPGIEVTTGPLGQGVANAVGFAMAKKFMHKKFPEIDHKVWCLCGDGDLEEGISYEACSIAGSLGLEDLIIIYDSNNISIEGEVEPVFKDDIKKRFEAQNFRVLEMNGHDYEEISKTLKEALKSDGRPTLIIAKTIIARGAVGLEGSEKTHGAPLGEEVIKKSKIAAGFDPEKTFFVPDDVLVRFRCVKERGELLEKEWEKKARVDEIKAFFEKDFSKIKWPEFEEGASIATRKSNGEILNAIAKAIPSFLGGSADLAPSNNTWLKDEDKFPHGRNVQFGIREHAMAAINNAFAAYGFLPYAATFLVFSDYLRGALRIAALSSHKNYWIFTHDSIVVGEDGPTHQPVEHITSLRAIPNLYVFRPADANENVNCWKAALDIDAPVAFALSRQGLKNITPKNADVSRGAYLLRDGDEKLTLIASGSEVNLAMEVAEKLNARVVSVPCFELFDKQDSEFKKELLKGRVVAIEANRGFEWYKYADEVIGMETFGASGKGPEVYKHFGFDAETIANKIKGEK
ncbi:transketolase [Caminibacter pacificus]